MSVILSKTVIAALNLTLRQEVPCAVEEIQSVRAVAKLAVRDEELAALVLCDACEVLLEDTVLVETPLIVSILYKTVLEFLFRLFLLVYTVKVGDEVAVIRNCDLFCQSSGFLLILSLISSLKSDGTGFAVLRLLLDIEEPSCPGSRCSNNSHRQRRYTVYHRICCRS